MRPGRVRRAAKGLADLFVAHSLIFAHQEGRSLARGQRPDCGTNLRQHLLLFHAVRETGLVVRMILEKRRRPLGVFLPPADLRKGRPSGDSIEPGPSPLAVIELGVGAERPQEGLLEDVLRILGVFEQTPQVGVDLVLVPLDERLKRRLPGYDCLPSRIESS